MKMGERPVATKRQRIVCPSFGLTARGLLVVFTAVCVWLGSSVTLWAADQPVQAQKTETLTFRGEPIEPFDGLYVVKTDVKIRAAPNTRSKRLGVLEEGLKVRAFGRAKGPWLAVKQDDEEIGFVYSPVLYRLFEGALDDEVRGQVALEGARTCDYIIRYTGTSPVDGEFFETSDYEVGWRCAQNDQTFEFESFLFVTEALIKKRRKSLYEVTLDIWEIQRGYEEVFSTTVKYDPNEALATFHSISIDKFSSGIVPDERTVTTVPDMLSAAVEMIVSSWNEEAWTVLKNLTNQPEPVVDEPDQPKEEPAG